MSKSKKLFSIGIGAALFCYSSLPAWAQSFSDVPMSSPYYTAVESLKTEGVIGGYPDGTFKPSQIVNRAEALKIIFTARKTSLNDYKTSTFKDVSINDWFFKFVETARELQIVNGNPDGTFAPARQVNKAEFLKMMELGYGVKFVNYELPNRPLYADLTDFSAWFVQYFDFAKNLNLITPDAQDNISPSIGLSRGEVADIIYKFELIMKGGPVQMMLSRTEAQLMQLMIDLQANRVSDALVDIANAKNLIKQALDKNPNEKLVKAASKVVDAFDSLTNAYSDVTQKKLTDALTLCSTAYKASDDAIAIDTSVQNLANQVKAAAKSLADSIRAQTSPKQ